MSNEIKTEKSIDVIRQQRAKLLSREEEKKIQTNNDEIILVFYIGKSEKYGIKFSAIEKIIEKKLITQLPGKNSIFSGLLYHNSEIWPVVLSQALLNISENGTGLEKNFLLIRQNSNRIALEINQIIDQTYFNHELLTSNLNQINNKLISGIYNGTIAMIEVDAMFNRIDTINF